MNLKLLLVVVAAAAQAAFTFNLCPEAPPEQVATCILVKGKISCETFPSGQSPDKNQTT